MQRVKDAVTLPIISVVCAAVVAIAIGVLLLTGSSAFGKVMAPAIALLLVLVVIIGASVASAKAGN